MDDHRSRMRRRFSLGNGCVFAQHRGRGHGQYSRPAKVHLHNPVLAYEVGDDFMDYWFKAAAGKLDPFVLVLEGIRSQREHKEGRLLGSDGNGPRYGQPITTNEWIDRLAPKALAVLGLRDVRYLWRNSCHGGQPDRGDGLGGLFGLGLEIQGRLAHR